MKTLLLAVFVIYLKLVSSAVVIPCPKLCKCEYEKTTLMRARCTSLKFLHKIDEKQTSTFQSLDLSNSSIRILDKRLKKLKNLIHLDLSNNDLKNLNYFPNMAKLEKLSLANNHLKGISFSILPKGIKDLDISSNYISDLPKDLHALHHLSSLHIYNNPINCNENAINRYVNLVSLRINITENVICHSPENVKGKNLQSLIADALLNPMLGDQEEATETDEDVDNSEFIKHTDDTPEKPSNSINEDFFDGSGDEEGSGDSDKILSSACITDCSTFKPLEVLKENYTSPLQTVQEQVRILLEDLVGKEQDDPPTTANPVVTEKASPVQESISKKTVTLPMSEQKTTKNTEKLIVDTTDGKNTENLERASLDSNEDGSTYYLVATVIILMVIVAIFIIIKKKSSQKTPKRKRNSMSENGFHEEMKPLEKYREISNGTNNEKQREEESGPERIPLMNGQNGKSDLPASRKGSLEDLDVTLRTPSEEDGLRPERVTITSSEIPPSILKTPQLVHRELNKDGEIVTRPLDDSY